MDQLADKMAASDNGSPAQYEAAFEQLMTHCSDSASKVESAIDTDASFLTINGYPSGATDWKFMAALRRGLPGRRVTDCSQLAADLVQATGVNIP